MGSRIAHSMRLLPEQEWHWFNWVAVCLQEGVFMIAFEGPRAAIEWAVLLQFALLRYWHPHLTVDPTFCIMD